MGANGRFEKQSDSKKRLSKNKSIKLYKEKRSKIQQFQEEVAALKKKYEEIDSQTIQKFDEFPLCQRTLKGLKGAGYSVPTEIQKDSIGLALKGHDILGAAKTGSGKTLAFVIPILECLYCAGWTHVDGLGALVITPTRELAYQIFEVLNKVGSFHHFSVALVIGGKDLAKERKNLDKCNILICTPGRLLQHMDENGLFDATNLKILVLDEADRILDMGFERTVNAILENLPLERQTLLFSATQTRSVKDLARLSLKNPVYVSVHEYAKHTTPESLEQNFLECEAHCKMNLLWSFLKYCKRKNEKKVLVFLATCKQVKFIQESIIRLKPGLEIMALHGQLHQLRRMQIYDDFCRRNQAVLFATDVASRGLDFPNVDWVVQLDCPEDTNTYIHRAGRTARFKEKGKSLLVLLPSEKESMLDQLKKRKIPIREYRVDPRKMIDVGKKLQAICAKDVNLKNSAQRAFKAYLKNVALMKDKSVFDVSAIDKELYAKSLGLVAAPRLRFLKGKHKSEINAPQNPLLNPLINDSDSDDDLLKPKGAPELPDLMDGEIEEPKGSKKPITKAAVAKRVLKKKIKANTVMKFDEEGNPIREVCGKAVPVVASEIQNQILEEGYSIDKARLIKEKEEEIDKILYKERIKQKHKEERLKLKAKRNKEQGVAPQLADAEDDFENASENGSASEVDPNDLMSNNAEEENSDGNSSEEDGDDGSDYNDDSSEDEEDKMVEEKEKTGETSVSIDSDQSDAEFNKDFKNSNKRKHIFIQKEAKKMRKEKSFKTIGHSLDDDEDLALHFLTNT